MVEQVTVNDLLGQASEAIRQCGHLPHAEVTEPADLAGQAAILAEILHRLGPVVGRLAEHVRDLEAVAAIRGERLESDREDRSGGDVAYWAAAELHNVPTNLRHAARKVDAAHQLLAELLFRPIETGDPS